jgi:hypothetical protein
MTDLDLDRLGDVWRQQPDPAELEAMTLAAESVRRRARWRRVIDIVAAIAVAAIVLFLVFQNPKKETVVVGAGAILLLLYGHYRQRRQREAELRSLTGSAEEMIDQSIARIETTIRHHRTSLLGLGPAFLVALLFSAAADRGGTIFIFEPIRGTAWFRFIWIGSWLALIALIVLYLLFAIRRGREELARLNAMRDAYRREKDDTPA